MKNKSDPHPDPFKRNAEFGIPRRVLNRRNNVRLLFCFIIVGLVVGAFAFGPFLVSESRRLPLLECLFIWWSDVTTLIATTILFVRHSWFGVPLEDFQGTQRRAGWLKLMVLFGIVGSLGADAWVSWRLARSESEAFATAVRTVGTIDSVDSVRQEKGSTYWLQCSFLVGEDLRQEQFVVHEPGEFTKLPSANAIRENRLPVSVAITYDPDNPRRCWLADVGCTIRLHQFSIFILFHQGLFCLIFIGTLIENSRSHGFLPWWHVLFGPVLLATQAGVMLIYGALSLFSGRPLAL